MLVTLSPAKTLDFDTPLKVSRHTVPELVDDATALAEIMRGKRPRDLRALMGISDKLAELNAARFHDWSPAGGAGSRQAVLAFMGDVYTGLDAQSLGARDLDWAQKHLRILSGLYGVLRPLDLIRPYRLEMGTALATGRAPAATERAMRSCTAAWRRALATGPIWVSAAMPAPTRRAWPRPCTSPTRPAWTPSGWSM